MNVQISYNIPEWVTITHDFGGLLFTWEEYQKAGRRYESCQFNREKAIHKATMDALSEETP